MVCYSTKTQSSQPGEKEHGVTSKENQAQASRSPGTPRIPPATGCDSVCEICLPGTLVRHSAQGTSLRAARAGTLCLPRTRIPASREVSRCSASTVPCAPSVGTASHCRQSWGCWEAPKAPRHRPQATSQAGFPRDSSQTAALVLSYTVVMTPLAPSQESGPGRTPGKVMQATFGPPVVAEPLLRERERALYSLK